MTDKNQLQERMICVIPFQTGNNNSYIYDANTGCVFASDEVINECIELHRLLPIDEVRKKLTEKYGDNEKVNSAVCFVEKMVTVKGAFYKDAVRIHEESKYINEFNAEDVKACLYQYCMMEQMVLNVTEDCNLRCKYCFFSEPYHNTRNRTKKMMTEEVAFRSLDFFFDRMREMNKVHPGKICAITFYGGEPLVNFELIKKCVAYIKENCPIRYMLNITTNGLLFKDEIADFLYENNFFISVSLDGNKENHDRNRVTENGSGSFDIIYKNLKAFQNKYPHYENIKIVSVYDYATTLMENNEFFNKENLPQITFVNQVLGKDTNYYERFDEEMVKKFFGEYGEVLKTYIQNKKDGKLPKEYADIMTELGTVLVLIKLGADDMKNPILPYTSTCVPGTKISVATDGKFYICEKVDCSSSIGSYKDGLDYDAIVEVIKSYNQSVTKGCSMCPLYRVCSACFSTTSTENGFTKPNCAGLLEFFKSQLTLVYTILENNPKAYEYFTGRIEWMLNK